MTTTPETNQHDTATLAAEDLREPMSLPSPGDEVDVPKSDAAHDAAAEAPKPGEVNEPAGEPAEIEDPEATTPPHHHRPEQHPHPVPEPDGQPATGPKAKDEALMEEEAPLLDTVKDTLEAAGLSTEDVTVEEVESKTVFALPYYVTPEGKLRVALNLDNNSLHLSQLADLVMEDHMQMQPLTNDSDATALTVNLGTHKNAPPLQAASDSTPANRLWVDADQLVPVAGGLPSLEEGKGQSAAYTLTKDGQTYLLGGEYKAVMDAAVTRFDAVETAAKYVQKPQEPTKLTIRVNNVSSTPAMHPTQVASQQTGTAAALQALHSAASENATDKAAQIA